MASLPAAAFLGWLLLFSGASARSLSDSREQSRERSLELAWTRQLDGGSAGKSPVQRVIALLKDMRAQLEAEADKESQMYDNMVCWCESNEKEKSKAIAEADAKTSELEASISGKSAAHGTLLTEITDLKEQIAEDKLALQKATEIREKELAEFSEEEKEMVQVVTNLRNAIFVLSSHHAAASNFLQLNSPALAGVRAVLRDASLKYELLLGDGPRRASRRSGTALLALGGKEEGGLEKSLAGLLGAPGSDALPLNLAESILARSAAAHGGLASGSGAFMQAAKGAQPGTYASYSSQSTGIFGILEEMREEFESNLSQAQKDEMKARADFEALSASKAAQITSGQAKLDELENSFAGNQKALADAQEDFALTRQQRTIDVKFLSDLRLTCQSIDKEWAERSSTRAEELKAVTETIAILTEDDAREHLAKTVNFLQTRAHSDAEESEAMRARRVKAATALRHAARAPPELETDDLMAAWQGRNGASSVRAPSAQLATLAVSVELDSFTRVKEAIDNMVADLKKEQEEEVATKAYCVKAFDLNAKNTYAKTEEKEDLEARLELLAATIEKLSSDVEAAKAQIAESKLEIKKASEAREEANAEFQTIVADQRATQGILTKALTRLEAFYKKESLLQKSKPTLLQKAAKAAQTPPAKFNSYKKNAGSTTVLGFLEQIVEDSKALESEAVAGEKKAQADYETFVTGSNKLIASLEEEVSDKTKAIASGKVDTEDAKSDHSSAVAAIDSLEMSLGYLHKECDFLMKNFNVRQKARMEEIEAILKAKAILSGM